jgi:hypothetical protein
MNLADFNFNSDSGANGYLAAHNVDVTLRLRAPGGRQSWLVQVWDPDREVPAEPITGNPPRASKGAPLITLVGTTSGQLVAASGPSSSIVLHTATTGTHSWIVRSIVDGGYTNGQLDPNKICERGLMIVNAGSVRKPVATEVTQFDAETWAGMMSDLIDVMETLL